jgi:hypothetical protein
MNAAGAKNVMRRTNNEGLRSRAVYDRSMAQARKTSLDLGCDITNSHIAHKSIGGGLAQEAGHRQKSILVQCQSI